VRAWRLIRDRRKRVRKMAESNRRSVARCSFLDPGDGSAGRIGGAPLDQLIPTPAPIESGATAVGGCETSPQTQSLGILCGFGAGAWLGAAEAPTKLVAVGISPVVVSLLMVAGVFLARWGVPALVRGTGQIGFDLREAPH